MTTNKKNLEMFKLEDRVLFDAAAVAQIEEAAEAAENNPNPEAQRSETDRQAQEDREALKNAGPTLEGQTADGVKAAASAPAVDTSVADLDAHDRALIEGADADLSGAELAADDAASGLVDFFNRPSVTEVTIDPESEVTLSSLADDSLVIVDATLPGSDSLLASAEASGRDVVVIAEDQGLADVLAYLKDSGKEYSSVHFFTHANEAGVVKLGADTITDADIQAETWREIGGFVADDGDVMLYGCNLAKSGAGRSLVRQIAELTDADVAASDDVTGITGDWELEYQIGDIDHEVFAPSAYDQDLAAVKTITVNIATDDTSGTYDFTDKNVTLREAIEVVNRDFYGTEHHLVNKTLGADDDGSLKYYDAKVEGEILTIYDESGAETHQFTLNTAGDAYVDASGSSIAANTIKTDVDGNVTSAFSAKDAAGAKVAEYDFTTNADYAATYAVKFSIGKATAVTLEATLSVTDTQWGLTVEGNDKITVNGEWSFDGGDKVNAVFSKGIYSSRGTVATFSIGTDATVTTDSVVFAGVNLQIRNAGTFNVTGAASAFRNGVVAIENAATGTVNFNGTTTVSDFAESALENAGTVNFNGVTRVSGTMLDTALVNRESGTVNFNGETVFSGNSNGAIVNDGELQFAESNHTVFSNNGAKTSGGAIYTTTSVETHGAVEFRANAAKQGGAVYVTDGATFTVNDGTSFVGNHAEQGGAIFLQSGTVQVNGGAFTGNFAIGEPGDGFSHAEGGAIYATADQDLSVSGGTFDSNFTGHYLDVRKAFGSNDVDADHARLDAIDWSAFDAKNPTAYIDSLPVEGTQFREIYAADGSFLGFAVGKTLFSATIDKNNQIKSFTNGTYKFTVTWGKNDLGAPIATKIVESVTKTTYDATTAEGAAALETFNVCFEAMSYQAIIGFDVEASGQGGAIYAAPDSTMGTGNVQHALAIEGATFKDNRAEEGGAVYADLRDVEIGKDARFDGNKAASLFDTTSYHAWGRPHYALDGKSLWFHADIEARADGRTSELINYDFNGNLLKLEATYEHDSTVETIALEGSKETGYKLTSAASKAGYKLLAQQDTDGNWSVRVYRGTFGKDGYWETEVLTSGYEVPDTGRGGAVFADSHTVSIDGATFDGNASAEEAGAIYVTSVNRTMTVTDSLFSDNTAGTEGGAVFFRQDLAPETGVPYGNMNLAITDSVFSGNVSGSNGGALYLISTTHADIIGSTFDGNEAAAEGGAISINAASVFFTRNNVFTGNRAGENGGALQILDGSVVSLTDAEFVGNEAGELGGAIYFSVTTDPITLTVADTTFTGNAAALRGGAVFGVLNEGAPMEKSRFSFMNDLFDGDNRAASGGAMAFVNLQSEVPFLITVEGSVFYGNRGYVEGGALAVDPNVRMVIKDSAFSENVVDATGVDADALARAALAGTMVQGLLTAGLDNVVAYTYGGGAVVNRGDFTATNIAFTGNDVVGKTGYYTYDQNWFGRYDIDSATGALVLTNVEATDYTETAKVLDANGAEVTSGEAYEAITAAWAQLFTSGTEGVIKTVRTGDTKIDGYDAAGNKVFSLAYSKKDGVWKATAGKAANIAYVDADGKAQKASFKLEIVYDDPAAKTGVLGVKYTANFKYKNTDGTTGTYTLEKTISSDRLESRSAEQLLLRGTNGETAIKATVKGQASYVTFDQASGKLYVGDAIIGELSQVDGKWAFTLTDTSFFGKVNEALLDKYSFVKDADNGEIKYLDAAAKATAGSITLKNLDGTEYVKFNLADLTQETSDVTNVKILTFRTEGTGGAILTMADDNAVAPAYDAATKIVSSTFFDNSAEKGGAFYQGSRFHTAQFDHGEAAAAEGEYLTADGAVAGTSVNLFTTVVDSTIAGNTSTDAAGYAYQQMIGESDMINDILVGNQRGTSGGDYDLQVKVSYLDEANTVKVYAFYRGGELVWLVDDNSLPTEEVDWTRTFEALWTGAGLDQIDNGVGDVYAADYANYRMLYTVFGEVGGDLADHLDEYVTIGAETTSDQTVFELLTQADGEGVWLNGGIQNAANVQVSAKEVERAIWMSVFTNLLAVDAGDKSRVDYSADESTRNLTDTWTENGSWLADILQKETFKTDRVNFTAWIGDADTQGTVINAVVNNEVLKALGSTDLYEHVLEDLVTRLWDDSASSDTSESISRSIAEILQMRQFQALTTAELETVKALKDAACWADLQSRLDNLDATAGDTLLKDLGLIVQDGEGLWTAKDADYKLADYTGAFAKFASTVKDDGKTVDGKTAKALANVYKYRSELSLDDSESNAVLLAKRQILSESMAACLAAAPLTDTDVSVTVDMSHLFNADAALGYVFGQTKAEIADATGGAYITITSNSSWTAERVTNWTGIDHTVVDGVETDAVAYAKMETAAKYEALWNAMSPALREAAVLSAFDLQNEHAYADLDAWAADTDYATKTAVLESFLANVKLTEAGEDFTFTVAASKAVKATNTVSLYISSAAKSYAGVPSVDGLSLKDNFDFTSTYMTDAQREMLLANYNAQVKDAANVLRTWSDAVADADFRAFTSKQFLAKGATLAATFQKFYDKVESGTEKDGLGFSKISKAVNDLPKVEVVAISPVAYYHAAYIRLASEADGSLIGVSWARPVSNDDAANRGTRIVDGESFVRQNPSDAVYNDLWGVSGGDDLSTDQIGTAWDFDYNQNRGAYWINAEANTNRYALMVTQATDTSVASFDDVDMTDGLNLRELVWLIDNGYAEANLDMDGDGIREAYEITFAAELFADANTITLTIDNVITWGNGGEDGDSAEATNKSGVYNLVIDGGANRNVTITSTEDGAYGFLWTANTAMVYNLRLNHLTVRGFNDSAVKITGGEKITDKRGEGAYQEKLYSTLTIEDTNFYENTAKTDGGAVNLNKGSVYVLGTDSAFDRASEAADVRDRDWTPDYGIDAKVTYTATDGVYLNGETVLAEGTVIVDGETGVPYAYTKTEDGYQFLNALTMIGGEEGTVSYDKETAKEIFAEGYVYTFTEIGGEETNDYTLTKVELPSGETVLRWLRDEGGLSVEYTGKDTVKTLYTYNAGANNWTAIGAKEPLALDGVQATKIVMSNGATYEISATDAKSITSEIIPETSIAISYHYDGSTWHEVNSGLELDLTTVTSVIGGTTFTEGKIQVTTAFDGVATAFRDNAAADGKGGAIYVGEGKVVLGQADGVGREHDVTVGYGDISFAYNTATKDGGAIYVKQATDTTASVSENAYHLDLYDAGLYLAGYGAVEFHHNAAGHDGGAAYIDGAVTSEGDNTVTSGAGNIRGADNGAWDLSLEANAAKDQGGAFFAANSIDLPVNELSIERNSVGGELNVKGGALYANNDITLTLTGDAKTANIDGNLALGKNSAKGGALYAGDDVTVGTDVAGSMYLVRDNRVETSGGDRQVAQGGALWARDVKVRNLATVTGNAARAVAPDVSDVQMEVEGGALYAIASADIAMVDGGTTAYWQGNSAAVTANAATGAFVTVGGGAVCSKGSVKVTDLYAKDNAATFTDEGDHDFSLHTETWLTSVEVFGGAISGSGVSIVNSEFGDNAVAVTINNLESVSVGYMYVRGGAINATNTLQLKHTINEANNNAPGEGFKGNSITFDASNVGSFRSVNRVWISGGAVNASKIVGNDDDLGISDVRFSDNSIVNTIIASEAGGVYIQEFSVSGGALNVANGNGSDPLVLTDVAFLNNRISNTVLATNNGHAAHCNMSVDGSDTLLGWTSPDEANVIIHGDAIVEGGAFWYGGTNELHLNSVVVGNGTVDYGDGTTYDSGNGIVSRVEATRNVTMDGFTVAGGGIWAGKASKTSLVGVAFDGNTVDSTITADSDGHLSGNGCEDGDAGTGDPKKDNGNLMVGALKVEGGAFVGKNATFEELVLIENSVVNSRAAGYVIRGGVQYVQAAAMRVYGDLAVKPIADASNAQIRDNFVYFGVRSNLIDGTTIETQGGQVLADTISEFNDVTVQNTQAHDAQRATVTIDVVGELWSDSLIVVRGGGVAAKDGAATLTNAALLDNGVRMTLKNSGTVQVKEIEISGGQLYANGDLKLVNTTVQTTGAEPTVEVYTQENDAEGNLAKVSIRGGLINSVKVHGAGVATDGKATVEGATLIDGNRAVFDLISQHGSLSDDTEDLRINTIYAKGGGLYAAGNASFTATDDGTPKVSANELDLRFENHANKNTGTFVVGDIDLQGGGVYSGGNVTLTGVEVLENALKAAFLSSTGMYSIDDSGAYQKVLEPNEGQDLSSYSVTHTTDDDGNDLFELSVDKEFAFDGQGVTSMMIGGNNCVIWICTSGEYTYYWLDGSTVMSEIRTVDPGTVMYTYHKMAEGDEVPGYDVTAPYQAQVGKTGTLKYDSGTFVIKTADGNIGYNGQDLNLDNIDQRTITITLEFTKSGTGTYNDGATVKYRELNDSSLAEKEWKPEEGKVVKLDGVRYAITKETIVGEDLWYLCPIVDSETGSVTGTASPKSLINSFFGVEAEGETLTVSHTDGSTTVYDVTVNGRWAKLQSGSTTEYDFADAQLQDGDVVVRSNLGSKILVQEVLDTGKVKYDNISTEYDFQDLTATAEAGKYTLVKAYTLVAKTDSGTKTVYVDVDADGAYSTGDVKYVGQNLAADTPDKVIYWNEGLVKGRLLEMPFAEGTEPSIKEAKFFVDNDGDGVYTAGIDAVYNGQDLLDEDDRQFALQVESAATRKVPEGVATDGSYNDGVRVVYTDPVTELEFMVKPEDDTVVYTLDVSQGKTLASDIVKQYGYNEDGTEAWYLCPVSNYGVTEDEPTAEFSDTAGVSHMLYTTMGFGATAGKVVVNHWNGSSMETVAYQYWKADGDGKMHWYKTETPIWNEEHTAIIRYEYSDALDAKIAKGDIVTSENVEGKYYYLGEEMSFGSLSKTAKYAVIAVDYAFQDQAKIIAKDANGDNCSYSDAKFAEKVASGEIDDPGNYVTEKVLLQSGEVADVHVKYVKGDDGNDRYTVNLSYKIVESSDDADGDGHKDMYINVKGYQLGNDNMPVAYDNSDTLYSGQNIHGRTSEMEVGGMTVDFARNAIWGGTMVSVIADETGTWHLGSADGQVYQGENHFDGEGVCTGTVIYRKTAGDTNWYYVDDEGVEQTYKLDTELVTVADDNVMVMSVDEVAHDITIGADEEATDRYGKYVWTKTTTEDLDTTKKYVCDDDGKTIVSYQNGTWMAGKTTLSDRYVEGVNFKLMDDDSGVGGDNIAVSSSTRVDGTTARMVLENDIRVEGAGVWAARTITASAATVDLNAAEFRIRADSSGSFATRSATGTDAKAATHADAKLEVKDVKVRGGGMFAGKWIKLDGTNEVKGNSLSSEVSATSDQATVKVNVDGAIDKANHEETRVEWKDPDDHSKGTVTKTYVVTTSTGIDAYGSANAVTTVNGDYDVMGGGLYTESGATGAIVLSADTTVADNTITGDMYSSTQDVYVTVTAKSTVSTFAAVHDRILYIIHPTTYQGQLLGEWESFGAISEPTHMMYGYKKDEYTYIDPMTGEEVETGIHFYDEDDGKTVGKGIGVSAYAQADAINKVTGEMRVEGAAYNNGVNKTGAAEVVVNGATVSGNQAMANLTATTRDATVHSATTNQVKIQISTTDAWAGLLNGWATAVGFTDGEDLLYSTGPYWENVSVSSISHAEADNSGVNLKVAKAVASDSVTVNDKALSGTDQSFSASKIGKDTRDHLVTANTFQGTDVNYIQTFWCKIIGEVSKVFTLNAYTYFFYWAGVQNTYASNIGVEANIDEAGFAVREIAENTANPIEDSSGIPINKDGVNLYNQDTGDKLNRTRVYYLPAFFLGMPCPHISFTIPPVPVPGVHTAPMAAAGNLAVLTKSILYKYFEKHSDFNLNYLYHTESGVLVEESTDAKDDYISEDFRVEVKGDVAALTEAAATERTNTDAGESWLPYTIDGTVDELYGTVVYVGEDFSNARDLNSRNVELTDDETADSTAVYVRNRSGRADGSVEGSLAWAIAQVAADPTLTIKFASNLFVNNTVAIEMLGTVELPTSLKMDGGKDANGNNRNVTISAKEAGMFFDTGYNGGTTSDWLQSEAGKVTTKGAYSLFSTGADATKLELTNVTFLGGAPAEDGGIIDAQGDLAITATNALFERGNASANGGAISVDGALELVMINSQFAANNASANGGAVNVTKDLKLTGDGVTFAHNETEQGNGGAMNVGGDVSLKSQVTAPAEETDGVKFIDNAAGSDTSGKESKTGIGGALFTEGAVTFGEADHSNDIVTFQGNSADENAGAIRTQQRDLYVSENVSFIDNAANGLNDAASDTHQGEGGAIWMADGEARTLVVDGALFKGNTASEDGGAIYLETVAEHSLKVKDGAAFIGNTAVNGDGGAIRFVTEETRKEIDKPGEDNPDNYRQTEFTIENARFEGNAAGNDGGAVFNDFGRISVKGAETLFTDNKAGMDGGAIANNGVLAVGKGVAFDGNAAGTDGGAIAVSGTLAEIDGAAFKDNRAGADGGALVSHAMETLLVRDSSFSDNSAENGGAIGAESTKYLLSQSNVFDHNYASVNGGAIDVVKSELHSNGDEFASNLAGGDGGAVSNTDGGISIKDAAFIQNTAREDGGAVATTGEAITQIEDTYFTGNRAGTIAKYIHTPDGWFYNKDDNTAETGNGGAIANLSEFGTTSVTDSAFSGNVAARDGGAIYAKDGEITVTETQKDASDFVGNAAGVSGGAIAASDLGSIVVTTETEDGLSFTDNAVGVIATTYAWVTTEPEMSDLNADYGTMNRVSKKGSDGLPAEKRNIALTSLANGRTQDLYHGDTVRSKADVVGGGAISANGESAAVSVSHVEEISGNDAYKGDGGAISASDGATLTISDVGALTDNVASGNGGAISVDSGATVKVSQVADAQGNEALNGGFVSVSDGANLEMDDLNLGVNYADDYGGQFYVNDATLSGLSHSSIQSGNAGAEGNILAVVNGGFALVNAATLADPEDAGNGDAAAVYVSDTGSEVDLVNTTITDNQGAGLKVANGATAQLVNDIVLGNGTDRNIEVDETSKINLNYSITDENSIASLTPDNVMDGSAMEGNITDQTPADIFVNTDENGNPIPTKMKDSLSDNEKFGYPVKGGSVADTEGTDDPALYLLGRTDAGDRGDLVHHDFSSDIGSVQANSPRRLVEVPPLFNEWQQPYYHNLNFSSRSMYEANQPLALESRAAALAKFDFSVASVASADGFRVPAEKAFLALPGVERIDSMEDFIDLDSAAAIGCGFLDKNPQFQNDVDRALEALVK